MAAKRCPTCGSESVWFAFPVLGSPRANGDCEDVFHVPPQPPAFTITNQHMDAVAMAINPSFMQPPPGDKFEEALGLTGGHVMNCLCYRDKPPAMGYAEGGEDPGCVMFVQRIRAAHRLKIETVERISRSDALNEAADLIEPEGGSGSLLHQAATHIRDLARGEQMSEGITCMFCRGYASAHDQLQWTSCFNKHTAQALRAVRGRIESLPDWRSDPNLSFLHNWLDDRATELEQG